MKSATLAAAALTEEVSHRLMALAEERRVSHESEGTEIVPDIRVYDDVLPDPEGYRALALAHTFRRLPSAMWSGVGSRSVSSPVSQTGCRTGAQT
jgi:hypothetical protein